MSTEIQTELRSFDEDDDWDDDAAERTFLIFELASERYAIPVKNVSEILRVPDIAMVPDTPAYVCGAVNLRGGVVPVIDLRIRFGLPAAQRNNRQVLILVEEDESWRRFWWIRSRMPSRFTTSKSTRRCVLREPTGSFAVLHAAPRWSDGDRLERVGTARNQVG